jgi:hypothetical protein
MCDCFGKERNNCIMSLRYNIFIAGNAVDQLFSILTKKFKSEIRCLEDLVSKIKESGIVPRPGVLLLDYIFDWRLSVSNKLTDVGLKHHSNYHAFCIVNESGFTKFRGKQFVYDAEWVPSSGIRILKEGVGFEPVGAAEFRVDKLMIPLVRKHLEKYFNTLQLVERMSVRTNWDRLFDKMENVARRRSTLEKMNIQDLPRQVDLCNQLPDDLENLENDKYNDIPDLSGEVFPEVLDDEVLPEAVDDADFSADIQVGMDVCIYSQTVDSRPWVGRVLKKCSNSTFLIHWYERVKADLNKFKAVMLSSGEPYSTVLETASVILWNFSIKRSDYSFSVPTVSMAQIEGLYEYHDERQF